MNTVSQLLERQVHRMARRRVRGATQPGTVWNVCENEMQTFLNEVLQERLDQEQAALLGRAPYERGGTAYRNGSKPVSLRGLFSRLRLRRPVLRGKTPRSPVLDLLKRAGEGLVALIASRFWLRGTATRGVAQEINLAFGTKLAASDVSRFTNLLLPDIKTWLERPVPANIAYLFLDALYLPVRKPGFTTKQALLVALGITTSGQRQVLGFLLGDREDTDSWTALINDLLKRGLNRAAVQLVISDDHKAIRSAVSQVLGVSHQLCVIHKLRNAMARVSAKHRKDFYADFTAAYWAPSKDAALLSLGRLQARWQPSYPKAAQTALADAEHFLQFFSQPEQRWTLLRSTNWIERFNRELRRRLNPAGAMQTEDETWKLVWAVSTEQEKRWGKQTLYHFKAAAIAA